MPSSSRRSPSASASSPPKKRKQPPGGPLTLPRSTALRLLLAAAALLVAASLLRFALERTPQHAVAFFVCLCVASVAFLAFAVRPIPQSQAYHRFADARTLMCSIPNTNDVVSNAPFLLLGVMGILLLMATTDKPMFVHEWERYGWIAFFFSSAAVAFGSAYYHWSPNDKTLVWDRLPITLGFMSLYSLQLEERLGVGSYVLVPSVVLGAFSVYYWRLTDDLRVYFFVQFYPLLTLPLVLTLFPPAYSHTSWLWAALAFYVLAKVTEVLDRPLYTLTGRLVSGHTLKHAAAAVSIACVYVMLSQRVILPH